MVMIMKDKKYSAKRGPFVSLAFLKKINASIHCREWFNSLGYKQIDYRDLLEDFILTADFKALLYAYLPVKCKKEIDSKLSCRELMLTPLDGNPQNSANSIAGHLLFNTELVKSFADIKYLKNVLGYCQIHSIESIFKDVVKKNQDKLNGEELKLLDMFRLTYLSKDKSQETVHHPKLSFVEIGDAS